MASGVRGSDRRRPAIAGASAEVRRNEIIARIAQTGSITVADVCARYGVSEVTARNDLTALAEQGLVRRVRGGACSIDQLSNPSYPERRRNVNAEAKRAIARAAAEFVEDGDRLIVDAGTTMLEFVRALAGKKNLSITTYDLEIALYADTYLPNVEVTVLGGTLQKNRRYLAGPLVNDIMRRFYFDKVFLCTDTFAPRQGFATKFADSASIKASMIKQSRLKYMLMDSSKIGITNPVRFATIEDIDVIIVDRDPGDTVALSIDALALNAIVRLIKTDERP